MSPHIISSERIWDLLEENEILYRLRMLWERIRKDERPAAIERRLSVEGKRPTLEEVSDLSKLWLMLLLRLHGRSGANLANSSAQRSGYRLSWGEFQLAFSINWHAMVIKRIFDILDRDGDGIINFEDFARGLFPLASSKASLDDKLHFLFQCLDLDGNSAISREDLLVHLHLYAAHSLLDDDCGFSPEQLDGVIAATFAEAELDANGHIGRSGFAKLLRAQPRLLRQLEQQLCLNTNKTIANLIIGLDESWLEIGARPRRDRDSSGPASWCDRCSPARCLRSCRPPSPPKDRPRRPWDGCLRHVRSRWREQYVPTLVTIVP